MKIDSNSLIIRKSNIVEAEVDSHTVVMSIDEGRYLGIGGAGRNIWELLKEEKTVEQLVESLTAAYAIDPGRCRDQTLSFLEQLVENGLVELRSPPS